MDERRAALLAAKRRELRTLINPLEALIYEPLLDEPVELPAPAKNAKWERELHCGFCKKQTLHQKLGPGVEIAVIYCTRCGWGRDDMGTFSRASRDYGQRIEDSQPPRDAAQGDEEERNG